MKKVLVFGVILLFLGVGFQPALANEVSINTLSDIEEDCGCQPVNRVDLLRVRLLLIKLETIINVISSRFGYIPEVKEKCEEIFKGITNFQERINDLKPVPYLEDFPKICDFLFLIYLPLWLFFLLLPLPLSDIFLFIFCFPILIIATELRCDWLPIKEPYDI